MNYFTSTFLTGTSYFFAISNKCSFLFFVFCFSPLSGFELEKIGVSTRRERGKKIKGRGMEKKREGFQCCPDVVGDAD